MKFIGGPRHGQDVPDWVCELAEVYVETAPDGNHANGSEKRARHRYVRRTCMHPEGHRHQFFASAGSTQALKNGECDVSVRLI